jgi:antitoxin VapB
MSLNITNRKVEEKAILASHILGTNKTAAVEYALDYYLQHHMQQSERNNDVQEASRLLDELAELPILDQREADEIIGYNENGLP